MKRVMALILVIKDMLLKRIDRALSWQQLSRTIDVEMIQKGQVAIFKVVQAEFFDREIKHVMSKKGMVPNYSNISQLDPFLNSDNIVRVGGRLRKPSLTEVEQHPVIHPKKSAVSDPVIPWSHINVAHGERGLTLNHLRNNGISIISANAAVQRVIQRCVTCCKLLGKTSFQIMADLPVERCAEVPPFTYYGVDIFYPYLIKEKRAQLKRYGALFTCFTCRAIHREVTNALHTNSFIQGSWQEEVLLDPSGQRMEQILWEQEMNCSKDSKK